MRQQGTRAEYWRGFRDGAPFLVVLVPFGMVFGVIGTEAGLNLAEVMGFSVLVIAGAAQITAVQMMSENAPVLVVLATALAVNLRMAMYSAGLAPHLGDAPFWKRGVMAYFLVDQSYGISVLRFEARPDLTGPQKVAYFFGTISPVCLPWYLSTWAGAVLGTALPAGLGLDFAVPIAFIAIVTPMLRSAAHVVAALVSIVLALLLAFLPYNAGLLIAAVAAMVAGAQVEVRMARARAAAQGGGGVP